MGNILGCICSNGMSSLQLLVPPLRSTLTTQLCPDLLRNEDGCTNAQGVFTDGDSLPKVWIDTDGAVGCDCLCVWGGRILIEHRSECDR